MSSAVRSASAAFEKKLTAQAKAAKDHIAKLGKEDDESAPAADATSTEGEISKVKKAISEHMEANADDILDLVDAFLKLSPEQQAHAGEMHQLGCSGHSLNLTTDDCWRISEKSELEANVVRDLAATIITTAFVRWAAKLSKRFPLWAAKLSTRTAKEVERKVVGFQSTLLPRTAKEVKDKVEIRFKPKMGARLKLTGTGPYEVLPCITNIIHTTSKAFATGGEDFLYYLNESRAMNEFAFEKKLTVSTLPTTKGSRQSIAVQLPTAILRNLSVYLEYIHAVRADEKEMNQLLVTAWDGLRDRHVVAALRARSFVDVAFTTPMIFFTHHHLVTRPMIRTIMDAAEAFIEGELAPLSVLGSSAPPTHQSVKDRVFAGLRGKGFDVAGLEAAYAAWWEGAGDAKGMRDGICAAWEEATTKESWAYVSAFLSAASGPMLATHRRNLDKDCIGIPELEYAPITTDFVESGFAHLDLATRTLVGAGMDACIGVAHSAALGAFQTAGARRHAARDAVRRDRRSTGASSAGMAVDGAEVDAKVEEFLVTSFFSLPKEERWAIIQSLQRNYQTDIVEANRDSLKAEARARLARLRLKKEEHIRLCAMRCEKYADFLKIEPCRSIDDLCALCALHKTDYKACAEALRDQIRVRLHVYKVKASDLPGIGSDSPEVAVARLMDELRPVVVSGALPRNPPQPVPYPDRAPHPAPTAAAAVFQMAHLAAISAALVDMVELMAEGYVFNAPRRRAAAARASTAKAPKALKAPTGPKAKRAREPTPAQAALEGQEFEEDGVDWKVLAVVWDATAEEVVVWYYDVGMAAEGDLTEDDLDLARTEGFDLGPLECSSVKEVKFWINAARSSR